MNVPPAIEADPPLGNGFRLEGLTIDTRTGDVSGPGGREKLDPKVMDVLLLLAQNAGHVVPREDLLGRLWPNVVVSDDALTRCVYELRRQLSLAGGDEHYKSMLETLPKRGYRLNGKIDVLPPEQELRGARERPVSDTPVRRRPNYRSLAITSVVLLLGGLWFVAGRSVQRLQEQQRSPTPAAPTNSIAVLPFVDMSESRDQGYLSDGIAEEILDRLTRIDGLRVIARTSSFSFTDRSAGIPEIAAKLNVSHVLEGSVRKSGDRVRITTQLVEASSNSHLWSKTYDRGLDDLFAVQDEIAASVASALDLSLGDTIGHSAPPVSAEAHQLFLQAEFFFNRRAPGDIELSVKYYEDAVSLEPDYARAWAALAGAYNVLADSTALPRAVVRAKQGEAARRAVALEPRSPESHYRLAQFYFESGDRDKAREHFRVAEALYPGRETAPDSDRSEFEADIEHLRREAARDPLSALTHSNLGVFLVAAGQLEEAKSEFRKALELSPDNEMDSGLEIARVLVLQQRYDEARSAISRLPEGSIRDHGLALLYSAPGHRADADAALERLIDDRQPDLMDNIRLAEVHAFRGSSDDAIATLQQYRNAIDRNDEAFYSQVWWMQREMSVSPFLAPLRTDPRWTALMAEPP